MTTEDLLKPRYKVIAEWPRMTTYWIGRIFTVGEIGIETQIPYYKYPHLFKKLEWWEDRDIDDLPEYVKGIAFSNIVKVKYISADGNWFQYPTGNSVPFWHYTPATKEEYENQKQLTK